MKDSNVQKKEVMYLCTMIIEDKLSGWLQAPGIVQVTRAGR